MYLFGTCPLPLKLMGTRTEVHVPCPPYSDRAEKVSQLFGSPVS